MSHVGILSLRHINTFRKVPLQVNFFRWLHFELTSMSLIFLCPRPLLSWAGIFKKSMAARNRGGIGLPYRPARLHRLADSNPRNRFLVSLNVYKYGLCMFFPDQTICLEPHSTTFPIIPLALCKKQERDNSGIIANIWYMCKYLCTHNLLANSPHCIVYNFSKVHCP